MTLEGVLRKVAIITISTIILMGFLTTNLHCKQRGIQVKARTVAGTTKEVQLYSGYYALVVSVGDYRAEWPKLPNPVRDSREVASMLKMEIDREKLEAEYKGLEVEKEKLAIVKQPKKRPSGLPKPGETWQEPVTGMEFVRVPGGCYEMGSPSGERGRDSGEGPVHEVCVDGFLMGKLEVTNAQYRMYRSGHNSRDYKGHSLNGANQPAVYVSWEDAKAYAKWLTNKSGGRYRFRLPTEAEWEYAARARTTTARYWGDDPDDACRYGNVHDRTSRRVNKFKWIPHDCNDGYAVTAPVGSFKRNPFGLYDMLGNIWEWCEDTYSEDAYSKHERNNPIYTGSGSYRVFRGGSWGGVPSDVRSANRYYFRPGFRDGSLGFRLLRMP